LIPVEHFERCASRLPLARPFFLRWQRCAAVDPANPALSPRPAVDPVLGNEFEYEIRCGAREVDQTPSAFRTEVALEIVRIELEARDDLAAIASGCSPSRFRSLDEYDVGPRVRRVVGGRESRESPADHTEFGGSIPR
jgi:hypothetical protein